MFHLHGLLHEIGSQVDLSGVSKIDIAFDGVDEVDFNKNLLKVRMLHPFICLFRSALNYRGSSFTGYPFALQCGGPAHTMQKVRRNISLMMPYFLYSV